MVARLMSNVQAAALFMKESNVNQVRVTPIILTNLVMQEP